MNLEPGTPSFLSAVLEVERRTFAANFQGLLANFRVGENAAALVLDVTCMQLVTQIIGDINELTFTNTIVLATPIVSNIEIRRIILVHVSNGFRETEDLAVNLETVVTVIVTVRQHLLQIAASKVRDEFLDLRGILEFFVFDSWHCSKFVTDWTVLTVFFQPRALRHPPPAHAS